AFLTKLSEELQQDVPNLEGSLAAEGVKRVFNSITKAVTSALVSSLTSANAIVAATGDYLTNLLDMEASIDPTWASPDNCWMMDRSSLSKFRNLRDLNNRPVFDPTAKTLLSYRVILNDACHAKVIFGSFRPGVYIRKTPFMVLRQIG